jgi:hypothetical protein
MKESVRKANRTSASVFIKPLLSVFRRRRTSQPDFTPEKKVIGLNQQRTEESFSLPWELVAPKGSFLLPENTRDTLQQTIHYLLQVAPSIHLLF